MQGPGAAKNYAIRLKLFYGTRYPELYLALFDQEDNAPRRSQFKLFQFPRLFTLKALQDMSAPPDTFLQCNYKTARFTTKTS